MRFQFLSGINTSILVMNCLFSECKENYILYPLHQIPQQFMMDWSLAVIFRQESCTRRPCLALSHHFVFSRRKMEIWIHWNKKWTHFHSLLPFFFESLQLPPSNEWVTTILDNFQSFGYIKNHDREFNWQKMLAKLKIRRTSSRRHNFLWGYPFRKQ